MAAYPIVFSDRLTKDGELLTFGQPQADTSIFHMKNVLRLWFMLYDTIYLENDRHTHNIFIADYRYFRYAHFTKALPWLKRLVDIFFTGYSERVKAIHVINAPPELDVAIYTLKKLLPKKIARRFFVHSTMEDLCKMVDEDVVCSDLGGKGPTYAEYKEYTWNRLLKYREWFLERNYICSDEDLRLIPDSEVEEMAGSFRKLEVD